MTNDDQIPDDGTEPPEDGLEAPPEDGGAPPAPPEKRRRDTAAEAAARRKETRKAEAERDSLREALTASRRQIIEALIGPDKDLRGDGTTTHVLHDPRILWNELAANTDDFFDEEGVLDRGKLADFVAEGTAGRDYLTAPIKIQPPRDTVGDALNRMSRPTSSGEQTTGQAWSAALKGD